MNRRLALAATVLSLTAIALSACAPSANPYLPDEEMPSGINPARDEVAIGENPYDLDGNGYFDSQEQARFEKDIAYSLDQVLDGVTPGQCGIVDIAFDGMDALSILAMRQAVEKYGQTSSHLALEACS